MIRTTNVKNGVISLKGARFVEKATFEKWTRRAVPKLGDVVLTREALDKYLEVVKSTNQQKEVLAQKNENLKKQRDMLLPKLISGQIQL